VNFSIKHIALIDNAAACSLANKRGVGKIRHLEGKLLWIQEKTESGELQVEHVESALNVSDLGTKPLTAVRLKTLSFLLGAMDVASGERVGQAHYEEMMQKVWHGSKVMKIAKVILRLAVLSGSVVAAGSLGGDDLGVVMQTMILIWWLHHGGCLQVLIGLARGMIFYTLGKFVGEQMARYCVNFWSEKYCLEYLKFRKYIALLDENRWVKRAVTWNATRRKQGRPFDMWDKPLDNFCRFKGLGLCCRIMLVLGCLHLRKNGKTMQNNGIGKCKSERGTHDNCRTMEKQNAS
jgi:hypothetical protein